MGRQFEVHSLDARTGKLLGVIARHSTLELAQTQVAALERLQLLTKRADEYPVRYAAVDVASKTA